MTTTAESRAAHVAAYRASGQTYRGYAESHDLRPLTLKGWVIADKRNGTTGVTKLAFARAVMAKPKPALVVEVRGARVVVETGFDSELLRRVVDALGGRT